MIYHLKQYDETLITISMESDSADLNLQIMWVNEEKKHLLPLDMELSETGVERWLKQRTIPKNRAFVNDFLIRCGMSLNRPMGILSVCKGLSLNDSYWVVEEDFNGTFDEYNLYENRFSRILGLIAFTGLGSSVNSDFASSPEFTTNGMLPKCWRRIKGDIVLYKGGTFGASNTGNEPYSEFYAAQVAQTMEIDAVSYNLAKWEGRLCSTCSLFTDKDHSFIPVGRLVREGGMKAVHSYAESLGEQFVQAIRDMLVFDAVIANTDRHYGNFGFIIDNKTNRIVKPAPLFDHGNSLFNFAGETFLASEEMLDKYEQTLVPCVYDDFMETANRYMNDVNRQQLRRLADFSFTRHSRYNLNSRSLALIEKKVRNRAMELLNCKHTIMSRGELISAQTAC